MRTAPLSVRLSSPSQRKLKFGTRILYGNCNPQRFLRSRGQRSRLCKFAKSVLETWLVLEVLRCSVGSFRTKASIIIHRESKKNKTPNSCPYLRQILIDFQNSFVIILGRKFAIKRSLQIPPHLKGVATVHCEILVSKHCTDRAQQQRCRPSAHALLKERDRGRRAAGKQL